jgi:hypothetical protein
MTNLFIKKEWRQISVERQVVNIKTIGTVSDIDPITYPVHIFIDRIKPTAGSTRTGKVYSVIELDQIMFHLFGFKHKSTNGKEAAVAYLTLPENIRIIERHNERLREMTREHSRREMREVARS